MIVRIRVGKGAKVGVGQRRNQRLAFVAAALLSPAALVGLAVAVWSLTADMNITRRFAISTGFFSHWQSWLAMAVAVQLCARMLNKYSRASRRKTSDTGASAVQDDKEQSSALPKRSSASL
jgi:hypothetical protein